MTTNRNAYVGGLLSGLVVAGAAAMVGMGQPGVGGGDLRVTSSGDGRTGVPVVGRRKRAEVRCLGARAPKGQGDEDEKAKGEEHGKGCRSRQAG
jgi:hypothetical protein